MSQSSIPLSDTSMLLKRIQQKLRQAFAHIPWRKMLNGFWWSWKTARRKIKLYLAKNTARMIIFSSGLTENLMPRLYNEQVFKAFEKVQSSAYPFSWSQTFMCKPFDCQRFHIERCSRVARSFRFSNNRKHLCSPWHKKKSRHCKFNVSNIQWLMR